jgi:hypothetical protein
MPTIVCTPRVLTPDQAVVALRRSIEVNPQNAREPRLIARSEVGRRGGGRRLAVAVDYKWPSGGVRLSVQFLDSPPADLRRRILAHMNAWSRSANVRFDETAGLGEVRIARLDEPPAMAGYWSYVGTQILAIEPDQPTLNLEGFTLRTPESEFRRVVRHEAGHTLGFEHEHMRGALVRRIDRRKAFAYYDRTQGWSEQDTIAQVLTPLAAASIMGTAETDPTSIMCYQIPAQITKDGKPIPGGRDINERDYAFAARLYPPRAEAENADADDASRQQTPPPLAARPVIEADTFHLVVLDRFAEDVPRAQADDRPEYVRVFASYGGARVSVPMRVRAGASKQPTRFGHIIATHERIKGYTNRSSGTLPDDAKLIEFGTDLFESLFQGEVRRLYDEARARQHGRKLDLVLTSMVPWIAEKPWEFAYDASRRSFLATEDLHFVRNVLTSVPADFIPPGAGPLRILVAAAQPAGFGRLSVEEEAEVIRRGFDPLIAAGLATVDVLPRATPSAIHARLLTGRFSIVHFIGHGIFDEKTQRGCLVFEDARGGKFMLGERSAREIFCQRGVRLVFLNACQSGSGGRADFNQGIAQSLVAHGLPALVANQYSVLDTSATHFAQHFYWALAQGMSVGEAAREARIAVNYALAGESIDWAIPVVYARDPGMTLCAAPAQPAAMPATLSRGRGRRGAPRSHELAVWDIDGAFPTLRPILERMQAAQDLFGFDLVDLSVPVDAWDVDTQSPDGTPYLWAERFANRLARMPLELGVDMLACITRHWMRSDEYHNIYGWWPEDGGPPILIFSFAGFDELSSGGEDTERAIVNVTIAALAGYLGKHDSHDSGPKNCFMSRNASRNPQQLLKPLRFDPRCRATLLARIPAELKALEAISTALDEGA